MLIVGLVITGFFILLAIFAPLLAPYGYNQLRGPDGLFGAQQPPSAEHWLGTTVGGYDVLSRVIWGAQTAILVIVVARGALDLRRRHPRAGLRLRRRLARPRARSSSPTRSTPSRRCCSRSSRRSRSAAASPSLWGGILAAAISITVVFIPQYFRVIRAETIRVKSEAFVESAKVIGASTVAHHVPARLPQLDAHPAAHLHAQRLRGDPRPSRRSASSASASSRPPAAEWGYDLNKSRSDVTCGHLVDRALPGHRDRADRARHHADRREPQRPGRPAAARPPTRRQDQTPADAVAATPAGLPRRAGGGADP